MSSLQDQLIEIQAEEAECQQDFRRLDRFNTAIEAVEWISGILSFIVTILCFIILFRYVIPKSADGFLPVIAFYGGIFIVVGWYKLVVYPLLKSLTHFLFKLSEKERLAISSLRQGFYRRRYDIQRKIKDEEDKAFRERERKLADQLDSLVGLAERKKITKEQVEKERDRLAEENVTIRNHGYQIHTGIFYSNRFQKIKSILGLTPEMPVLTPSKAPFVPLPPNQVPKSGAVQEAKSFSGDSKKTSSIPPTTRTLQADEIEVSAAKVKTETHDIPDTKLNKSTIPKEEEKLPSELFGISDNILANENVPKPVKQSVKVDFAKLNLHRQSLGDLGELYVFEKEKNNLVSQGRINLSNQVRHISLSSDSEGYDIVSFTDEGEIKYIEVKTTTGNEFEPFYLSTSEMEAMKRLSNYWIYRVYNFNMGIGKGDLYKIDCKKELDKYYNIQASTFRVTPLR